MSYAFRCTETGLVEFVEAPGRHYCAICGGTHPTYQIGPPERQQGAPNVKGDRLPKHWDWSLGTFVDSKSQRDRLCAENGMHMKSIAEHKRQFPETFEGKKGTGVSYAGQKNRRSAAERDGVRTGDGRRVL